MSTTVERSVDGASQVVPTIIRGANRKSVRDITTEIGAAQSKQVKESGVFTSMRAYLLVPAFLRRVVFRLLDRMPHAMKRHAGTVMVTSVGMFGQGAGGTLGSATRSNDGM